MSFVKLGPEPLYYNFCFQTSSRRVWFQGLIGAFSYIVFLVWMNTTIVLALATEAGLAESWYLPSFLAAVGLCCILGLGLCLVKNETNIDDSEDDLEDKEPGKTTGFYNRNITMDPNWMLL